MPSAIDEQGLEASEFTVNSSGSKLLCVLRGLLALLPSQCFLLFGSPRDKALDISLFDSIKLFASEVTQERSAGDLIAPVVFGCAA